MVETKVQEEVLYREGLAMGLDKDDTIVKRRMAQKMQFIAEDVAAAHEPTSAELKAWFEKNADKFQQPPRVSASVTCTSRRTGAARARRTMPSTRSRSSPASPRTRSSQRRSPIRSCSRSYYRDRAPEYLGKEFGPQFRAGRGEAAARIVAGPDRIRLRLAPRVRRHADSRPRSGLRGDRARREDGMARRAEGAAWKKAYKDMRAKYTVLLPAPPDEFGGLGIFADTKGPAPSGAVSK